MAINRQIITTHHHYIPRYTSSYSWKSTVTSTTTISDNGNSSTTSSTSATTTVPTTTVTTISDNSKSTKTLPIQYNYNENYSKYMNVSSEMKSSINNYNSNKITSNMTTIPIRIEPTKFKPVTVPSIKKPEYNKVETIYEHFQQEKNLLPVNRSSNLGVHFNGSNFGILAEHVQIRDSLNVSFEFRTQATNGVVLILVDSHTNNSFFLELVDSQLRACLYIDGEPDSAWTEFPTKILSSNIWVDVNIKISGNTIIMNVRDKNIRKTHRYRIDVPIFGDLFIAGHTDTIKPPFAMRSKKFFQGEVRSLKLNDHPINWYGTPDNLAGQRLRNWN